MGKRGGGTRASEHAPRRHYRHRTVPRLLLLLGAPLHLALQLGQALGVQALQFWVVK